MGIWQRMFGSTKPQPPTRRAFDAASVSRLTASWTVSNVSADQDILRSLTNLRARSRDLCNNNDYARKFLQMVTSNIVGPDGVRLQMMVRESDGRTDDFANKAIEEAWWNWCQRGVCDVTGKLSFADIQRLIIRAIARDGEALIVRHRGKQHNEFGFALQVLDVDRIDTQFNDTLKNGAIVRMGVELNQFGRPIAYHLTNKHPGDTAYTTAGTRQRIAADDVLHLFISDRPEQTRGIPWMHSAMLHLQMLGAYEESAIVAARVGAAKMGFITTPDGDPTSFAGERDSEGKMYDEVEPGHFGTLSPGQGFVGFDPEYPQANYGPFVKSCLRGIASGLGVAYNTLANDLEGVNFSSIRSGVIEERDNWMLLQNWFVDAFIKPVFTDWLSIALLTGNITNPNGSPLPAGKLKKFNSATWQPRRWQWVDPVKDMEFARLAITSGLMSPQVVAAQMGMDVDDVLDGIARFEQSVKEKKVTLVNFGVGSPKADQPKENSVKE